MDKAIERAVSIMAKREVQWFEELLSSLLLALQRGERDIDAETALRDLIRTDPPDDPMVQDLYITLLRNKCDHQSSNGTFENHQSPSPRHQRAPMQ